MTMEEAKSKASIRIQLFDAKGANKVIDQIFNDHEAQLKAKDEEINYLKTQMTGYSMMFDEPQDAKARSIVAMLFWEWRKSEARIYATNIKWNTGRAFQSQILFEAAYKILKEQQ